MYQILAQAIGFVAMALNISSYQLKNSRQLALCRATGDFIYIAHYLMLGAYSGCTTIAICALNGLVYSFRGNRWAEWKGWKWVFSILLVIGCMFTWRVSFQPVPSLCALFSVWINIVMTWTGKSRLIRMGRLFLAGPTWIVYAVISKSIPGALAELVGMTSAAIGLYRYGFWKEEDEI